jgi:hypothetical protein
MSGYNHKMKTTILLIRHGEVENPRGIFYGGLPRFGLSVNGRRQAAAAAETLLALSPNPPGAIYPDTPWEGLSALIDTWKSYGQSVSNLRPVWLV